MHPFDGLDGHLAPERTAKPRASGLTMVIDWGLGPHRQRDLIAVGADCFDFAKIAVGLSRLHPAKLLTEKIDRYLSWHVEPFPGGQFLEYAEVHGLLERYLPACVEAGYRWVEVSDNLAPVTLRWKERVIVRAVEEFGLKVLGEVGKKEGLANAVPLADDARACMEAGASLLLVEAAELIRGDAGTAADIDGIVDSVGLEKVMFELPGPWIAGVSEHHVHSMRRDLIDRFGPQANIGNVGPEDLLPLEAYRRGLGVNAGAQAGATASPAEA